MRDRVADVLAQRAALDRGAGTAIALSLLLHGGIAAFAVYSALHAPPSQKATMVDIQFAKMPAITKPAPAKQVAAPKIEDVKPKIEEPKPKVQEPPKKIEKNTVPLSPFGRSTKKGSETPPAETPKPAAPAAATSTAPAVPVGGAGVTGIEGGDFPFPQYLVMVHRLVTRQWHRPEVPAGAGVVIFFRILHDGTIVESRVKTSSGNATFDRAALSAVRSSNPLNPLPFAYNGTDLGVDFIFR